MKLTKVILNLFFFIFIIYGTSNGQTKYIVETTADFQFSPAVLDITVGDTVEWRNTSLGLHNVIADDNSFTSGQASTDPWVYTHVFTTVQVAQYYCSVHGAPGLTGMSGKINVSAPTAVNEKGSVPGSYYLKQNFPNPFNPSTNIEFSIPQAGFTELIIYNSIGSKVSRIVAKYLEGGVYTVEWNAANLSSGIYFYRLNSGKFTDTKKLLLLK